MIIDWFNEEQNENTGNIRSTLSNIYLQISEGISIEQQYAGYILIGALLEALN